MRWPRLETPIGIALGAALALAASAPASAQADRARAQPARSLVAVRLVSEQTRWLPGETQWLALEFRIEPGWHLYWKGRSDSGLPIQVGLDLPPGFSAGELRWPAPRRLRSPGDLLDHVYEEEATLLLPVTVPAAAPRGAELVLAADLSWLVCQEACLPGAAERALSLTVLGDDEPAPAAQEVALFQAARARLPGAPPADLETRWQDGRLLLSVPGASALAFFPEESCLPLADLLATGAASGNRLELVPDATLPGGERLRGVLRIERGDGQASHHELDLPGPAGPGTGG